MKLIFGTEDSPIWQQKTRSFFVKNGVWIAIILSIGLLIYTSNADEIVSSFLKGFYDGYSENCEGCPDSKKQNNSTIYFIGIGLLTLFFLAVFVVITLFIANVFYNFLFKFILQKPDYKHIILFVVWIIIIYNFIWEGLFLVFEKNNLLSKKDYTLKEYRENIATIIAYFILIFIVAYGLINNFIKNYKEQAALISQKSTAEIQALKAQINPHFLFNTLNNLYGTAIVEESPKTAEGIQQLAGIMRHAVESSKNDRIGIDKEVRFLHDYIEIQQIRIPKRDNIKIDYQISWDEVPAQIAPLILMTFIENAFKYGISINEKCFIDIRLSVDNQQLTFVCRNSNVQRTQIEKGTGTGIENTLKRLKLLYHNRHTININNTENIYEVFLTIDLNDTRNSN